jgi:hypothetical protein
MHHRHPWLRRAMAVVAITRSRSKKRTKRHGRC